MEIKIFEMRELKADEGMVLTDGKTFSSVGGLVYLGINDNPENWNEITKEEAKVLEKEILQKKECDKE